jgi:DNA-binding XRE family transcriptional regulator
MNLPSGIIFINADINQPIQDTLTSQLHITDVMSGSEFDSRVGNNPTYPDMIHANNLRILVIRESFHDLTNRDLADVVMFLKQGLAAIEKDNYGPPGKTISIERINIYDILRYNNSPLVKILPQNVSSQECSCRPNFSNDDCGCGLGGIFAIENRDLSGVHCPNPDNIYNNEDFLNRKS